MKIGCTVNPGEAAAAAACGFDYAEVSGKMIAAMTEMSWKDFRRELSATGLPCLGFNAYCGAEVIIAGPGWQPGAGRAYAERLLPRAMALGIRTVGIGSPRSRELPPGFDRRRAGEQAEAFLRETKEVFSPAGIAVCLEPLGRCYCNFINTVSDAAEIALRAGVEMVVDFYNMEHNGEANLPLKPFVSMIRHAHISDDDGTPQQRSYLKPEKAVEHTARISTLIAADYKGNLTLETDVPFDVERAVVSLNMMRRASSDAE